MSGRDELSPKYQGIWDKAKTGRSPKAAIQVHCLRCMVSKTKDIQDCDNEDCEFLQYRPYQKKPHKFHRPTNPSILSRSAKGQIAKTGQKSSRPVSKDVLIKNVSEGNVRVRIEIEPKSE